MSDKLSRREFLEKSALVAGLTAMGGVWTGAALAQPKSPNEKLNLACIGVGGQGASDLGQVSTENIVAMCDVDAARAADSFNKFPNAKKYTDYRKMLDEIGKQIDGVVVSTPDHNHAPASVMAMKMGKHVYCQKPLTHSIQEARVMMETARRQRVTTQMGTQGHPSYVRLVEVIQAGAIGPVTEVHVQTDRPIWPQGLQKPTEAQTPPSTLDWQMWLGPAADRPYNSVYLPFVWRGWWDFGTGALGDMACHLMDGAFWSLKLQYASAVEAECDQILPDSAPKWSIIRYEFPEREGMPAVKLTWYDGGKMIPEDLLEGQKIDKGFNGSLFIGQKGKILMPHGGTPKLLPEKDFADYKGPDPTLPRVDNHYQQWIQACKTGGVTGSNFDYAAPMTESILLGNVALRVGKRIEYDARSMRAKDCPEADRYIRYHYRKGWKL